jgi:hypothetical protein
MLDDLVSAPFTGNYTIFLSGQPGSGKTTLALQRLRHLLVEGVPAEQILVLVPQRPLATPYYQALHSAEWPPGGQVDVATIGGLARRTLELFWPLVAEPAGFAQPNRSPRFLTLETTQYYMDHVAEEFVVAGAFDGITISRARLVSQIIDNLNKAAAIGFGPEEIAARLKGAWEGESARLRIYDQVEAVALAFRRACLDRNLLDWSLQIEVFGQHLLPLPQLRRYLLSGYRHLFVDNVEEDIPTTHDLLRTWLPLCESTLVLHDIDGGYRVFLGADPQGALKLDDVCRERVLITQSHVTSPEIAALGIELAKPFMRDGLDSRHRITPGKRLWREGLRYHVHQFHPQMLDWVVEEISRLVHQEGLPAGEIAVLAPFLSDALRFSMAGKLDRYNIAARSHRPSRQLREEPAARCLLTLAKLAHPAWRRPPPHADVAHALTQSIADLDPVRSHLLAHIVYRVKDGRPTLTPFRQLVSETQERISFLLGRRYDELWQWLQKYAAGSDGPEDTREHEEGEKLDHFLSRLFGEVLSQPGFGFHRDFDGGAVAANLIESVQKFRQGFSPFPQVEGELARQASLGLEYVDMVERGVVAAQYVSSWQIRPEDAVLLVPAYTYLMMNEPVTVQFWLDAGSRAWSERIYQPLTHPYILRRDWPENQVWADEDEVRVRDEALGRLILGLSRRCRQRIYLAFCDLNERGNEQQGPLRQALQRILRERGEPDAGGAQGGAL